MAKPVLCWIFKFKFLQTKKKRIDLNFQIPVYSNILYSRFDRFSGEIPDNRPIQNYNGSILKLFNPNYELGYIIPKWGMKMGAYYQGEFNVVGKQKHNRVYNYAHSLSLRVIY